MKKSHTEVHEGASLDSSKRKSIRNLARGMIGLAAAGSPLLALADDQAAKGIRVITPFPPGAGPDAILRTVADRMGKRVGRNVVVENKPGANGFIAIDAFKRGATDGSDLLVLDIVHLAAYPYLFKRMPYDAARDFEIIGPLFKGFFFVAVPTNSPYRNLNDLVRDAKANPGKVVYGSWSVGNPAHLGGAMIEIATGTEMQHTVYKEQTALYTGLANGELNFALGTVGSTAAMVKQGRLRYIAWSGSRRNAAHPDVPTIAEALGVPFEMPGWNALVAPRSLPRAQIDKLAADLQAVLAEPEVRQKNESLGYENFPTTREGFAQYLAAEQARFAEVIRRTKASLS